MPVNNLHILKLAGCVNITGSGLDTLRSAFVIKQIDLSSVGKHESPWIKGSKPKILETVVIPILGDIISRGNSLKQLEFPKKWKWNQSAELAQFLERYNDYLINQRYSCSICEQMCIEQESDYWIFHDCESTEDGAWDWYGTQNMTCSQCVQHFCNHEDCADEKWNVLEVV